MRDVGTIGDDYRPAIGLWPAAAVLGLAGFPQRPLGNALAILLRALADLSEIGCGLTLGAAVVSARGIRRRLVARAILRLLAVIVLTALITGLRTRLCAAPVLLTMVGITRLPLRPVPMLPRAALHLLLRRRAPVILGMLIGPRRLMRLRTALLPLGGPRRGLLMALRGRAWLRRGLLVRLRVTGRRGMLLIAMAGGRAVAMILR